MASSSWLNLANIKKMLETNPAMADEALAQSLSQNASTMPANPSLEAASANAVPSPEAVARSSGMSQEALSLAAPTPVEKPSDVMIAQLLKQQMAGYDQLQKDMGEQRQGIDNQSERLAKMFAYQNPQKDITGTLMAFDTISGQNQASKYKKPADYASAVQDYIGLEDKLQQRRKDLTHTEADLLKQKLSTKLADADKKDERQMRSMGLKMEDNFRNDIDKNVAVPLQKFDEGSSALQDAINDGSVLKLQQYATSFAKTLGREGGMVTDQDAQRIIPTTFEDTIARLKARATANPREKASPEVLQLMQEMLDAGKKAAYKTTQERLNQKELAYKASKNYSPLFEKGAVGDVIISHHKNRISNGLGGSSSVAKDKIAAEMARRGIK